MYQEAETHVGDQFGVFTDVEELNMEKTNNTLVELQVDVEDVVPLEGLRWDMQIELIGLVELLT